MQLQRVRSYTTDTTNGAENVKVSEPGKCIEGHYGAGDVEGDVEHVHKHVKQGVLVRGQSNVSAQLLYPLQIWGIAGDTTEADNFATAAAIAALNRACACMLLVGGGKAPKAVHAKRDETEEGQVELDLPVVRAVTHKAIEGGTYGTSPRCERNVGKAIE